MNGGDHSEWVIPFYMNEKIVTDESNDFHIFI
ncbi:hypothetical protein DET59_105131 [Rossellomorea aquimaris]|uniref:Uncharacterized protein n=1 Tax=Rossellomorea aquimaris TaxID=189382 RepID=A0A366EQZ2_9BACI|nr:hypothetical protein DET59_105131 [Rossellomorea aquimaris]